MEYEDLKWFIPPDNYKLPGNFKDRTGFENENFKVIGRAPNIGRDTAWNCLCKHCNKYCVKIWTNLKRNTSCGCMKGKIIGEKLSHDLTNKIFGYLQPQYKIGSNVSGNSKWHCLCLLCGNECDVDSNNLTTLHTISCGCIKREKSVGAVNITKILKENNFNFKAEVRFDDLVGKDKHPYWYDFAIYKKDKIIRLIEYDGIQHYQETWGKWKNKYTLEDQRRRDKEKNQYALSHNIPLVRIPYWERDNITLEMIMGDQYLVKKE